MSTQIDPNDIFASLGIDLAANSLNNPKPPADGDYTINLKLAPIPKIKKNRETGKEEQQSKIIAGKDYAGEVIAPQGDAASLTLDDNGRANFTLYIEAEVLSPETNKRIRTLPVYVNSGVRNETNLLMDLAKAINGTYGATTLDLVKALGKYNTPGSRPNLVWKGLAEAVAELMAGNPDGLQLSGHISTNLKKVNGKKKGIYDEYDVLVYGSENIKKKFPECWTGDKLADGFKLDTTVKGFKT